MSRPWSTEWLVVSRRGSPAGAEGAPQKAWEEDLKECAQAKVSCGDPVFEGILHARNEDRPWRRTVSQEKSKRILTWPKNAW